MNKNKVKIFSFLMTVLLVLSFAACESKSKETSSPPEQHKSVSQEPVKPEEEPQKQEMPPANTSKAEDEAKKSDDNSSEDKALPDEKKLDVTLEGEKEQRTAKLVRGDGYAMYMFEQFTFDKEKNLLYMNVDPRFKVRIEKLTSDFNLDDLMLKGKAELERHGKVTPLKESSIMGTMKGSRLFLMVQDKTGTYEYIVKELDGNGYIFHVDIPQGEAAEGFAPLAFATLNTIKNQ